jgi:hypothetical protein
MRDANETDELLSDVARGGMARGVPELDAVIPRCPGPTLWRGVPAWRASLCGSSTTAEDGRTIGGSGPRVQNGGASGISER